ncbi:thiol reductant ABC exporter subunit CydD [Dermatobacter hominis]|uniref:thiol reductant ABC exporter subunit CydD n=1 Tax=Dermatobacter hominis TaxID=2884263 RepID=UPI001D12F9A5|nr:thiol reductant ABC exporter subunit CydD [Dermatobacter hominis]UDY36572.1 thiol reductant ABC exporter subunit CydD [Dermatobacter hominis]
MPEPVRPVVDGGDPLDADPRRPRRGPIDPALLQLAPSLRRHLVVCAGLAVVATVVVLAQAEVIGRQLPHLIDGDLSAAAPLAAALAAIALVRLGLRWGTEVSASIAAAGARRAITDRVVRHALAVDEPGAAEATPARVTTLVTDGVDALDPWIRNYVPALCLAGVVPLAAGARILLADVASAVILLVAIPLIPVFMVLIGKLAEDRANRQWATLQRLAGHFHDVLVGLPTLRLFGRAEAQVGRVRAVAEQYRLAVMRTLKVAFLSAATMELLAMLSVALVAVTVGYRLTIGAVTLETALIVLLLAPECSLPIRRVGAAFHAAQAGTDAAEELKDLLRTSTTPDGPVDALPAVDDERPVLRIGGATVVDPERGRRVGPVDATVAAGTVVALVGASGAGKSTLLDAVRGRVPLHRGAVELEGIDVTRLSRRARTAAIAWVPQLPEPVGADVRAAVGGRPDDGDGERDRGPDRVEVDRALAALDLSPLADRAPQELSGGERQRVAVARAVVATARRDAGGVRLLLADEPTSHLDPRRADLVLAALRSVADAGTAVVVATHDSRLIEAADQVVLLDDLPSSADGFAAAPSSHADADPAAPRRGAGAAPIGTSTGTSSDDADLDADLGDEPAEGVGAGGGDLAWFRRMARPVRARLLLARALGVAAELCTVGLAATAAWLIVRASQGPSFADLAVAAVAVRAFGLGKGVLRYVERLVSHDAVFRLLADVRGAVVGRLGQVAPAGVPGMARGDVMSRVVDDVDRLADEELRVMGPMVAGLTVGVGVVAGAALAAPGYGAVYAVAVAVVGIGLPAVTRLLTARTAARQAAARSDLAGGTLELVEHVDELTTTGAAGDWTARISGAVARLGIEQRRRGRRVGLVEGVAAATAPLLAAAVVVVDRAAGGVVDGPVLGVLVLVPFALLEVLTPLLAAGEQQAAVHTAARRLRAVLEAPDPVVEPASPVAVPADPVVALDDVALRWPRATAEVVTGLDLRLSPGEHARIDGPSGSGKSTVAAALVRFIEVQDGTYRLGGVDTALEGGDHVRRVVTWCQQSPWLAATSLRENLHIAAPHADDDELWAALDAVRLSDWAIGLPDGLSTLVGRDGSAMSGGQRQRLALARVLLADHRVVVLDEPTAHLDAATARAVMADLLDALGDRTVLVLGHGTGTVGDGPTVDWSTIDLSRLDPAPTSR